MITSRVPDTKLTALQLRAFRDAADTTLVYARGVEPNVPTTFPACPTCTQSDSPCEHRRQYELLEEYIRKSESVSAVHDLSKQLGPEKSAERSWKGGQTDVINKRIVIYRDAVLLHGWAMLSSILIHEFGHLKLYAKESLYFGIHAEVAANQSGKENVPSELLPFFYDEYRAFALQSYVEPDDWDTKEKWQKQYERWLARMIADYPSA